MYFKRIKTILLATDLSEDCRTAFELSAALATSLQGTLVFLHVIEGEGEYMMNRIKTLIGDEQWHELQQRHVEEAHDILIAKQSSNKIIQMALRDYCDFLGSRNKNCQYESKEIIITEGNLTEVIVEQAEKIEADVIVMGNRKGFIHDNSLGNTIKTVMRTTKIPVLVAPTV